MYLKHIKTVQDTLYKKGVIATPLVPLADSTIFLKLENLQPYIRCYKLRGALHALGMYEDQQHIVTASAGNFAQGLAWGCKQYGKQLHVLVPNTASEMKLARIRAINADVQIITISPDMWWQCMLHASTVALIEHAHLLQDAIFISPATNRHVIDGNATIGLEILDAAVTKQAQELHIFVPYGGGGLITGIAQVMQPHRHIKVFACEVNTGAPLHASLAVKKPVHVLHTPSFIDGIGASTVLPEAFAIVQHVVEASLVVTTQQVAEACHFLLHQQGLVVEGAGAVSLAAAWHYGRPNVMRVCVISGGNIAVSNLLQHTNKSSLPENSGIQEVHQTLSLGGA